jgi:hypothetical protein
VTQALRNLLMDLEDAGNLARVRFLIRDRDARYPALLDKILSGAGISTVLTGVRMPRMNSIAERWATPKGVYAVAPVIPASPESSQDRVV